MRSRSLCRAILMAIGWAVAGAACAPAAAAEPWRADPATRFEPIDLGRLYNSRHNEVWEPYRPWYGGKCTWQGFGQATGYLDWFSREDVTYCGVPFRVSCGGFDAVTVTVTDLESFRIEVGRRVGAVYVLGAGLVTSMTDIKGNVLGGYPANYVEDPRKVNLEFVYADGRREQVMPVNVLSRQRHWYNYMHYPEFAVESFSGERIAPRKQNVFLYCAAPSSNDVVAEVRFNDWDIWCEPGLFAATLADRAPAFAVPNPSLPEAHGEPLMTDPPVALDRLRDAVDALADCPGVEELSDLIAGMAEQDEGGKPAVLSQELLAEAFAWLERPEVIEFAGNRLSPDPRFRLIDMEAHFNDKAADWIDYGLGVDFGTQQGSQPPFAMPVVELDGVPYRVALTGDNVLSGSVLGYESYRIDLNGATAGEIYFLGLCHDFWGDVSISGSVLDLNQYPEIFAVRILYADGDVDEAFPMSTAPQEAGLHERAFAWATRTGRDRPLSAFPYRFAHRDKSETLPGGHVVRPRFYKPIEAIEFVDRNSRMDFAIFGLTLNTHGPTVVEKPAMPAARVEPPAVQRPVATLESGRLELANAWARLVFRAAEDEPLALLEARHVPVDLPVLSLPEPVNLFAVNLDGETVGADAFRVVNVRESDYGSTREVRVRLAAGVPKVQNPLEVELVMTVGRGPELRFDMEVYNAGESGANVEPIWLFQGVRMGELVDNYVYYPGPSGVVDNVALEYGTAYGGGVTFQYMDTFNPRVGAGVYLRSDDCTGEYKTLFIRKAVEGEATREVSGWGAIDFTKPMGENSLLGRSGLTCRDSVGMSILAAERKLAARSSRVVPGLVIGFHVGDWHEAARAYRTWLDSWYRHDPLPESIRRAFVIDTNARATVRYGNRYDLWAHPESQVLVLGHSFWSNMEEKGELPYQPVQAFGGAPGLREAIERLRPGGVGVVVPYLEGIMPPTQAAGTDGWDKMFAHDTQVRVKTAAGDPGGSFCPGSDLWQSFMAHSCRRLVRDAGTDGVYIDSLANIPSQRCFDPTHGHPAGSTWPRFCGGYFRRIRQAIREENPQALLMTENVHSDYVSQVLDFCWYSYHYFVGEANFGRLSTRGHTPFLLPEVRLFQINDNANLQIHYRLAFFYGHGMGTYYGDTRTSENRAAGRLSYPYPLRMEPYMRVLKENADAFASRDKEPWLPTLRAEIYANRFTHGEKTIFTIHNNRHLTVGGELLGIPIQPRRHYVELLSERALDLVEDGHGRIAWEIAPKDVAAVAELPQLIEVTARSADCLNVRIRRRLKGAEILATYRKGRHRAQKRFTLEGRACEVPVRGLDGGGALLSFQERVGTGGYGNLVAERARQELDRQKPVDKIVLKLLVEGLLRDLLVIEP